MMGSFNNPKQITQQMGQMYVRTLQPTTDQDIKQYAKPFLNFEIIIVQSMGLKGKKKNYKDNHSVNPSQTLENIIVQSMELRGNKNKYKSKQNANFGKGYALSPAQENGKQQSIV